VIKSDDVSHGDLFPETSFEGSVSFNQLNCLTKEVGNELLDAELEIVANTGNTSLACIIHTFRLMWILGVKN
jgi:hypothetical protein